ncbi:MAG: hypothetical protein LBQ48_02295 [Oscillospiraceae bacterium]|jgi:hypothetical protein|nr:hypothetical protein [Oscillospiraceae bacterium]
MTYENLLQEATDSGYAVTEKTFKSRALGLNKGTKIGIRNDLLCDEKLCVLAEEIGHALLTVGNILDRTDIGNMKQEHKARCWAYRKLIGGADIQAAIDAGCREYYEFAEHLGVSERFLRECMQYYAGRDGPVMDEMVQENV